MYTIQEQIQGELEEIRNAGAYKQEKSISGWQGVEIEVEGKKLLNFCANNYLGLAGSHLLVGVAKEGLDKYGFGMASVRFICGTSTVHKELEAEVSKFFQTEDTILYGSCFDANTGLFETILTAEDAIISDELNHASIIDGVRLCKAERYRYLHSDMVDLESKLKEAQGKRRILVVTDGVFSMDGETAKLKEICDLADTYGALVVVDESHDGGVSGETGRGAIEVCDVMSRVDLITGTFGKAFGGASGGFTTGKKEIIELLRQRSRTTLFSNSLAPSIAHAALWVLRNFEEQILPLRGALADNTKYFREKLTAAGFDLGGDGTHPITPVMLYDEHKASAMASQLYELGIYVRGFTYPVVPKGKARIRVQLSAAHTQEHLDKAIAAFIEVNK